MSILLFFVLALGWLASEQIEMSSATAMGEHHSMLAVTTRRTKLQKGFHEFHEPCLQVWNCESNTWIQLVHSFEVLVLLWFCCWLTPHGRPARWVGYVGLSVTAGSLASMARIMAAMAAIMHPKLGRCGFSQLWPAATWFQIPSSTLGSHLEFLRFLLLGLAFIASLVPETKGRSFAEIEALLSRPRRDVPLIPMDSWRGKQPDANDHWTMRPTSTHCIVPRCS